MQSSQLPSKIQLPWAKNAAGAYIRTVPVASQIGAQAGAASWNDGFVPLNFTPIAAGGVAPFGQDTNGVLNTLSSLLWWYSAGGAVVYDSAFQTAVGGYPKGAVVQSAVTFGVFWISTTENNATNPDAGGAGWTNAYSPPAGTVLPFAGISLPVGYLLVPTSQTLVSTTTYANLFSALGYTWGGSGSSFGLPFLAAGYVPVQGSLAVLSHGALLAHTHSIPSAQNPCSSGGTPVVGGSNSSPSGSTGGSDNLAAGMGHSFIVKF